MRNQCKDCGEHVVYCTCRQRRDIYESIFDIVKVRTYTDGSLEIEPEEMEDFILELTGAVYKVLNGMD